MLSVAGLVAKLFAWVAPGTSVDVALYTPAHACVRAELARDDGDRLSATVVYPPANPSLWPFENADYFVVGAWLIKRDPNSEELGSARWGRITYGTLSYVDAKPQGAS